MDNVMGQNIIAHAAEDLNAVVGPLVHEMHGQAADLAVQRRYDEAARLGSSAHDIAAKAAALASALTGAHKSWPGIAVEAADWDKEELTPVFLERLLAPLLPREDSDEAKVYLAEVTPIMITKALDRLRKALRWKEPDASALVGRFRASSCKEKIVLHQLDLVRRANLASQVMRFAPPSRMDVIALLPWLDDQTQDHARSVLEACARETPGWMLATKYNQIGGACKVSTGYALPQYGSTSMQAALQWWIWWEFAAMRAKVSDQPPAPAKADPKNGDEATEVSPVQAPAAAPARREVPGGGCEAGNEYRRQVAEAWAKVTPETRGKIRVLIIRRLRETGSISTYAAHGPVKDACGLPHKHPGVGDIASVILTEMENDGCIRYVGNGCRVLARGRRTKA
jgi:hypothetical protein